MLITMCHYKINKRVIKQIRFKKMERTSTVVWKGTLKEGSGTITSQSNALDEAKYAWNTRFENEPGTNPEELLAAAHASCFTMQLNSLLNKAGFKPEVLETSATVTLKDGSITDSHLVVDGNVSGVTEEKFKEL